MSSPSSRACTFDIGGVRIEDTVVVTDDGCYPLTTRSEGSVARRMATVSTNDLKNGMTLDLAEGLFKVVEFQHVKPGKGGAFVRTKLKNVRTGAVVDRTFRADEKLEQAIIDKREMQFLYRDGDDYVFMDNGHLRPAQRRRERARRRDRATSRRPTTPSSRCTATRSSASTCRRRSS